VLESLLTAQAAITGSNIVSVPIHAEMIMATKANIRGIATQ